MMRTEYYPGAVVVLGIFLRRFCSRYVDVSGAIVQTIIDGLTSSYPLKIPLCFAVSTNAGLFREMPEILREMLIPALIGVLRTQSKSLVHWVCRALWSLLLEGRIDCFPPLSALLEAVMIVPARAARYLFSFFGDYLGQVPDAAAALRDFVSSVMNDPNSSDELLSEAVGMAKSLLKRGGCDHFSQNAIEASKRLLRSDCTEAYDVALGFIGSCIRRGFAVPLGDVRLRVIAIVTGEIAVVQKVRIAFAYFLAKIPQIEFPCNVVHVFFAEPDGSEARIMALMILRKIWQSLDKEHLRALANEVFSAVKASTSPDFVNEVFGFAHDLLGRSPYPEKELGDLARAAVQGRLRVFGNAPPYTATMGKEGMCGFLKAYVEKVTHKARKIVAAVIHWIIRASDEMVVPLLQIIVIGYNAHVLDSNLAGITFRHLLDVARDDGLGNREVHQIIAFADTIRHKYTLSGNELFVCLEEIWHGRSDDKKFVKSIIPVFLKLMADGSAAPESSETFEEIVDIVYSEEYHLDYPCLMGYFVVMADREMRVQGFPKAAILLFLRFLTKTTVALEGLHFKMKLLVNMHRCLKHLSRRQRVIMRSVEQSYSSNSVLASRLSRLLSSSKLPQF
jgi:hypothetical protein